MGWQGLLAYPELRLGIVKPVTFIGWHRQAYWLCWRWKSKPGRPVLPKDLLALSRRMALGNPTWSQDRIANVDTSRVYDTQPPSLRGKNES